MKIRYPKKLVGSFPTGGKAELFFGRRPEIILEKSFSCIINYDSGTRKRIFVPKGFKTDGASIPRIFWCIESPFGRALPAAVIHDYEYKVQKESRLDADDRFYDGMEYLGIVEWKRNIMYLVVRIFGYFVWKFKRKIKK